jgi:deazaflavin-dependent oxidoreductase (nitroreductase family)
VEGLILNWHKLYDPVTAFILKSPLHGLLDRNLMLVTVTGRKSGKHYTTPVNYLIDGDTLLTVSLRSRTWWRNLRNGGPIEVRLKGRSVSARGEVCADDNGVTQNLKHYLELAPNIARYMGVQLRPDGQLNCDDIAKAARERVMVQVHLNGGLDAHNN